MMSIEHVVILVKENHTFDNYFGTFPGVNGAQLAAAPNPPLTDPDHKHQAWMARTTTHQYEVQYGEHDIPAYFHLARQYTLCDNYFSEIAGPSTPNHLMLICADAPIINNPSSSKRSSPEYDLPSLPDQLAHAGLSWANYGGYAFHFIKQLAHQNKNYSRDLFARHAAAGNLPSVSWVYGDGRPNLSEHPINNVTDGADWTAQQIAAIVRGGLWEKTMVFVTWDDWGGWYDHVLPDVVERWDPKKAQRAVDAYPEFKDQPFRYGSRVPCLVIGPYAKAKHISHQLNSHVSIVRFCQKLFNLPALNERDGLSNAMADCVDFKQKPLAPPQGL